MTKLVYFAWVRERIGKQEEDVSLLKGRGEEYAHALRHSEVIRVAIDHEHVDHRQKLAGAGEIALFPPMTGG